MHLRPVVAVAIVVLAAAFASWHALVGKPKNALDFDPSSVAAGARPGDSSASGSEVFGGDAPRRAARMPRISQRLVVYVAGEVARPGLYRLSAGARADDAVRAAGGATTAGDLVAVNLAEPVTDGQEIAIPARGSPEAEAALATATGATAAPSRHRKRKRAKRGKHARRHRHATDSPAEAGGTTGGDASQAAGDTSQVIDVNASSETELEALPGIGPALAERIVAFRDLNGPFASADELLDVAGMTPGKLDALADLITFH